MNRSELDYCLLESLFREGLFNLNEEINRAGALINTRVIQDNPAFLYGLGAALGRMIIETVKPAHKKIRLMGVPSAGSDLVAAVMQPEYWEYFRYYRLRETPKKVGVYQNRYAMTKCPAKDEIHVLVDDFLAHGLSKIKTFEVLENEGFHFPYLFTLFDFNYEGRERILKKWPHIKIHAWFAIDEALTYFWDRAMISERDYGTVREFIQAEIRRVAAIEKKEEKNRKLLSEAIKRI